ncbi:hypothetical protein Q1695_015879 [Nippostrongylus brasiliensis]|nr:hypothetical protein Q1695_015879 [Nippostrongylus brasiliensis]
MTAVEALLLLLFTTFTADAKSNRPTCWQLPYHDDERRHMIKTSLEYHEGLNLTFDCQALYDASYAAGFVTEGKQTHVDHYWCQYSRIYMDPFGLTGIWVEPALYKMPKDKITQTAKLHPGTKYGCAYRKTTGVIGPVFATVCIYQRKAPETRCFCN